MKIKTIKVAILSLAIAASACSENKTDKSKNEITFDYSTIDSLMKSYDINQAKKKIESLSNIPRTDSITLSYYLNLINRLNEIKKQLKEEDKEPFIKNAILSLDGYYENTTLGNIGNQKYTGDGFSYTMIKLLTNPKELLITTSYKDRKGYYYHIVTDIDMKSDKSSIRLGNGFGVKGETNTRPINFNISNKRKQISKLLEESNPKVVFKTAITYNDRAYYNSTIWDIKGGEKIKYNDSRTFNERKEQILEKGEIKIFEIDFSNKAIEQFSYLNTVHDILVRNNVK